MNDINLKHYRGFSAFFLFALFFPVFHNSIGLLGGMLVNGGLIIGLTAYFLVFKNMHFVFQNAYQKKLFVGVSLIFIFFLLHISLSMLVGATFGEVDIIQRDLYEFHRPILYLLTFAIAFIVFSRAGLVLKFERLLLFAFFVLVLIGLNQYFGFYDYLSQLYTKEHNVNSRRVSAPFVNPYDYAFMMSFFNLYFLLKTIYARRIFILPFVISLVMFILPQSRSVAGTFLVCFFVVLPLVLVLLDFNLKRLVVSKKLFFFAS